MQKDRASGGGGLRDHAAVVANRRETSVGALGLLLAAELLDVVAGDGPQALALGVGLVLEAADHAGADVAAAEAREGRVHVPLGRRVVEREQVALLHVVAGDHVERAVAVDGETDVGVAVVREALGGAAKEQVLVLADADGVHGRVRDHEAGRVEEGGAGGDVAAGVGGLPHVAVRADDDVGVRRADDPAVAHGVGADRRLAEVQVALLDVVVEVAEAEAGGVVRVGEHGDHVVHEEAHIDGELLVVAEGAGGDEAALDQHRVRVGAVGDGVAEDVNVAGVDGVLRAVEEDGGGGDGRVRLDAPAGLGEEVGEGEGAGGGELLDGGSREAAEATALLGRQVLVAADHAEAVAAAAEAREGGVHVPLGREVVERDRLVDGDIAEGDEVEPGGLGVGDNLDVRVAAVRQALRAAGEEQVAAAGEEDRVHGGEGEHEAGGRHEAGALRDGLGGEGRLAHLAVLANGDQRASAADRDAGLAGLGADAGLNEVHQAVLLGRREASEAGDGGARLGVGEGGEGEGDEAQVNGDLVAGLERAGRDEALLDDSSARVGAVADAEASDDGDGALEGVAVAWEDSFSGADATLCGDTAVVVDGGACAAQGGEIDLVGHSLGPLVEDGIGERRGEVALLANVKPAEAADDAVAAVVVAAEALEGNVHVPLGGEIIVRKAVSGGNILSRRGDDALPIEGDAKGRLAAVVEELAAAVEAEVLTIGEGHCVDEGEREDDSGGLKDDIAGDEGFLGGDGEAASGCVNDLNGIAHGIGGGAEASGLGALANGIVGKGVHCLLSGGAEAGEALTVGPALVDKLREVNGDGRAGGDGGVGDEAVAELEGVEVLSAVGQKDFVGGGVDDGGAFNTVSGELNEGNVAIVDGLIGVIDEHGWWELILNDFGDRTCFFFFVVDVLICLKKKEKV